MASVPEPSGAGVAVDTKRPTSKGLRPPSVVGVTAISSRWSPTTRTAKDPLICWSSSGLPIRATSFDRGTIRGLRGVDPVSKIIRLSGSAHPGGSPGVRDPGSDSSRIASQLSAVTELRIRKPSLGATSQLSS